MAIAPPIWQTTIDVKNPSSNGSRASDTRELRAGGTGGRLYARSLAAALAVHL